jgi:hypothetical protein
MGYGPRRTRTLIEDGANDLGRSGFDGKYGHGRINVARSIP